CPHCDKSFINSSFLQNHLQRRHPDEFEMQRDVPIVTSPSSTPPSSRTTCSAVTQTSLRCSVKSRSDSEKKSQLDVLKAEIREGAGDSAPGRSELDRFKAEEMARTDRKIEDSARHPPGDGVPLHQELPGSHRKPEQDAHAHAQTHAAHARSKQLKKQHKKWESRMQDIKNQHKSEMNQLLSEQSRDKEPVLPPSGHQDSRGASGLCVQLEPIQEMSEEDRDSSSVSERRRPPVSKPVDSRRAEAMPAPERRERPTPAALRRNPDLRKELRPALEHALEEKLEDLGVRPGQSGLKNTELSGILPQVTSAREGVAREVPQYWRHREDVLRHLEQRLQDRRRGAGVRRVTGHSPERCRHRHPSSLPTRVTQVMSGPPAKQAKTPQPTPRTRTAALPRISTPGTKTSSKASVPNRRGPSQDPRGRSPQVFGPQRVLLQSPAARPSPAARQQTPARGPALVSAANRKSAPAAVTSVVTAADSEDDDWSSDISELQEMDPKRLQAYQQPNAIAADKRLPAKRKC
ncbi:hypothetical protein NHX12_016243, partial [Muraenolepis orangiensis]